MACIASTFTGSVAALKASKVQVRNPSRRKSTRAPSPAAICSSAFSPNFRDRDPKTPRISSVSDPADPHISSHQAKSVSKVIKADIYPEFGTYPGGGESPIIPFGSEKNAEREVIHGRWAMLGVTGAWAAENGTGIPWFTAGTLCTPDDCTAVADKFPGAVAPLAPEGSGYPSFWAVSPSSRPRRPRRGVPHRPPPTPPSTSSPSVTCPPVAASTPSASPSPVTSRS